VYDLNRPGPRSAPAFTDAAAADVPRATCGPGIRNLSATVYPPAMESDRGEAVRGQSFFTHRPGLLSDRKPAFGRSRREGHQPFPAFRPVSTVEPLQEAPSRCSSVPRAAWSPPSPTTDSPRPCITTSRSSRSPAARQGHGLPNFVTAYTRLSKTLTENRGFYGRGTFIIQRRGAAYWQNAYNRGPRSVDAPLWLRGIHNFKRFGGTVDLHPCPIVNRPPSFPRIHWPRL